MLLSLHIFSVVDDFFSNSYYIRVHIFSILNSYTTDLAGSIIQLGTNKTFYRIECTLVATDVSTFCVAHIEPINVNL